MEGNTTRYFFKITYTSEIKENAQKPPHPLTSSAICPIHSLIPKGIQLHMKYRPGLGSGDTGMNKTLPFSWSSPSSSWETRLSYYSIQRSPSDNESDRLAGDEVERWEG